MSEGCKVRLVRCPKCESLLPELTDCSVYQCGGCGALLHAKKKLAVNSDPLEKLGKERDGEGFEKLESSSEKEHETENESNERKDRILRERNIGLVSNSLLRIENKETSILDDRGVKEQIVGNNDKYRLPMKHPTENRSEFVNSNRGRGFETSAGSLRSKAIVGNLGFDHGILQMADNRSRFSSFAYHGEGPSSSNPYLSCSSYGHGKQVKSSDDADGPNRLAHFEQDRAELLRKLDELKEQICRSGSVVNNQSEGAANFNPEIAHGHVTYNAALPPLPPDKHVLEFPYFKQFGDNVSMKKYFFPPNHGINEFPVRVPRVNPYESPGQYWRQPSPDYLQAEYMDFHQEQLISYPHRKLYHEPACVCIHCYSKNWPVPSKVPANFFGKKRFIEDSIVPLFRPQNQSPQANCSALRSKGAKSQYRRPIDIDSDVDTFHRNRQGKVVVAHGNARLCHPIAGAAPFIACSSCFELLKLPRRLKVREKNQFELRCGSCLNVLLLEIKNKRLVISIPAENKKLSPGGNNGSRIGSKEVPLSPEGTKYSVDFDNVDYDFQAVDLKGDIRSEDRRLNLSKPERRQGPASQSPTFSEDANSLDSMIVQRDVSYLAELPVKDNASPALLSSSFPEHLDDISSNHEMNRHRQGNEGKIIDQKKVALHKSTSQESLAKKVSSETEMEVSFNEYSTASLSQESIGVSKKDRPRTNRGSEFFLVSLIKRSFRDSSRSNQQVDEEKPNVSINGQLIPDHIVKKVKKLAGPIQPGDYWYDFQVGFWGVMGQPCLGIIPPFIKEFNYPMMRNCANGNTGVFVNGRELHEKDLDLLASRGLPTTKQKFYTIEISGRVYDKDSGKELFSLGKLAPTVEKLNRGFGMKVKRKM